jgi:hypothetical protein
MFVKVFGKREGVPMTTATATTTTTTRGARRSGEYLLQGSGRSAASQRGKQTVGSQLRNFDDDTGSAIVLARMRRDVQL